METAPLFGRREVLDWVNQTLDLSISKIEDTASGAIACQLLDCLHPGEVPMHKVNWSAKQNFECIANYKILQTCFSKLRIDKFVDVDRLISGKYVSNLEFMQWFKKQFESSGYVKGPYDCSMQRLKGKGLFLLFGLKFYCRSSPFASGGSTYAFASKGTPSRAPVRRNSVNGVVEKAGGGPKPSENSLSRALTAPSTRLSMSTRSPSRLDVTPSKQASITPKKSVSNPVRVSASKASGLKLSSPQIKAPRSAVRPSLSPSGTRPTSTQVKPELADVSEIELENSTLKARLEEQTNLVAEYQQEVDGLEKERNFYFHKLRDIEILLQALEDTGRGNQDTASIFKILYATADGFETIEDDVEAPHLFDNSHSAEVIRPGDEADIGGDEADAAGAVTSHDSCLDYNESMNAVLDATVVSSDVVY